MKCIVPDCPNDASRRPIVLVFENPKQTGPATALQLNCFVCELHSRNNAMEMPDEIWLDIGKSLAAVGKPEPIVFEQISVKFQLYN